MLRGDFRNPTWLCVRALNQKRSPAWQVTREDCHSKTCIIAHRTTVDQGACRFPCTIQGRFRLLLTVCRCDFSNKFDKLTFHQLFWIKISSTGDQNTRRIHSFLSKILKLICLLVKIMCTGFATSHFLVVYL